MDDERATVMRSSRPAFRAVVEPPRITLAAIGHDLLDFAAACDRVRDGRSELTLIDLWVARVDRRAELVVRPITDASDAALQLVVAWAGTAGYRRAWLASGPVELPRPVGSPSRAGVDCPTCGVRWQRADPEFWAFVHWNGEFPSRCELCGEPMPQWEVEASS